LSDEDQIVLYLGRIHKIKGINLLLNAFAAISQEVSSAKLIIAGPDDDGSSSVLRKETQALHLGDRVIFTGPLYGTTKVEAYVDADVYVLPSKYETFPNTILEAIACGTPVILTDRCGVAESFKRRGLVVEFDVTQLRDALLKVLLDPAKSRQLVREARELVQREFSWGTVIEEIENTYREVALSEGFD